MDIRRTMGIWEGPNGDESCFGPNHGRIGRGNQDAAEFEMVKQKKAEPFKVGVDADVFTSRGKVNAETWETLQTTIGEASDCSAHFDIGDYADAKRALLSNEAACVALVIEHITLYDPESEDFAPGVTEDQAKAIVKELKARVGDDGQLIVASWNDESAEWLGAVFIGQSTKDDLLVFNVLNDSN